jgi:hypothetical protein
LLTSKFTSEKINQLLAVFDLIEAQGSGEGDAVRSTSALTKSFTGVLKDNHGQRKSDRGI